MTFPEQIMMLMEAVIQKCIVM